MRQKPRAYGARAPAVHCGELSEPTPKPDQPQLVRLARCLLRKLTVEPVDGGWRARIVGFDARFWNGATSRTFSTKFMAIEAAKAASRQCGLPLIVVETLAPNEPPDQAA